MGMSLELCTREAVSRNLWVYELSRQFSIPSQQTGCEDHMFPGKISGSWEKKCPILQKESRSIVSVKISDARWDILELSLSLYLSLSLSLVSFPLPHTLKR